MLFPQTNAYRWHVDLSGFWQFQADPEAIGERDRWFAALPDARMIAVPGSWNDQLEGLKYFLGDGWYQTTFSCPFITNGRQYILRFGSASYRADVWLNEAYLGLHEGGHLPFEFDVTSLLHSEHNRLTVRVNGELDPNHIPAGGVQRDPLDNIMRAPQYPDANHDFFPYAGIHRPVYLVTRPQTAIDDLTVKTSIQALDGVVDVAITCTSDDISRITLTLANGDQIIQHQIAHPGKASHARLTVPDARLWSPDSPTLYDLTVRLFTNDAQVDQYTLPIGIRMVEVRGDQLLLNGKPVILRGFGRHEDFALNGRGYNPVVIVKDYELMRWIGANSFRTSHYPYAEQMLQMADKLGFLVIAETPSVEMYFHPDGLDKRTTRLQTALRELIARDKNHPSIIMWSIANEPINRRPEANAVFAQLFALARSLDATRPLTFASFLGIEDTAIEHSDVICLNHYYGWYSEVGQIDAGVERLSQELDALHQRYGRPIMMTEFGADALAGLHRHPPEMFSEEYQAEFVQKYVELLDSKPYVVGQHIWNLCDFATAQAITRVGGLNLKGAFTRDRQPKMVAHLLRQIWKHE